MLKKIRCKKCGGCCNTVKGIALSSSEAVKLNRGKIVSSGQAKIKSVNGKCELLERKLCSEYSRRPAICKHYPFVFINGRAILEIHCGTMGDLFSAGTVTLTRKEIMLIPFLRKSLAELERTMPYIAKQNEFEISDR